MLTQILNLSKWWIQDFLIVIYVITESNSDVLDKSISVPRF